MTTHVEMMKFDRRCAAVYHAGIAVVAGALSLRRLASNRAPEASRQLGLAVRTSISPIRGVDPDQHRTWTGATDFDSRIFEESPTDLGAIAVAGLVAQNLDTVDDDEIATMILDDGELDGLDEMVPRDEESLITAIRIATAALRSHSSVHDEAVESLLEGEVITNGMLRDMLTARVPA